ncbi:histidine phosphatase family protein [Nonomuraea typhae]|uniref:histidine phosphatase family protein n=1 Tax=Nonomuraea typhae TaxID=2603600 RepID=UPI0012F7354B|nr:histidine phosphatase family protein [Nonomuraea typhae]
MTSYIVEADGGSRGNPGPAGYGAVVLDAADRQVLAETAEAIGITTNNVAEYRGLIAGLTEVLRLAGDGAAVAVRMDSKLVIEQMAGRWKIKNEGLRPLALEANRLVARLRVTEWTWIPRERNKHADRLANEAMDAAAKGLRWQPGGPSEETATGPGREEHEAAGQDGFGQTDLFGTNPETGDPGGGRGAGEGPANGRGASGDGSAAGSGAGEDDSATGRGAGGGGYAVPGVTGGAGAARRTGGEVSAPAASAAAEQTRAQGTGWGAATRVATSLLLLRHGETPLSVERRFSGLGDAELTANGRAQAAAAADRLARKPYRLDVIVSSPLKRARQTAEAVAARTNLTVEVDEDLREADFGAWEGHTFTEIQRRWPDELAAWLADPSVAPPDGESFAEAGRRVHRVRDRLVEQHLGKTVLVVSHVTPIKMLLRFALMAPPAAVYRMHLDLACLNLIDYYADGNAVVKAFNDTAHLR